METNIPIEVLERIFALYWGQLVHCSAFIGERWVGKAGKNEIEEGDFLELTPLSLISDEDLAFIGFKFPKGKEGITVHFYPNSYDCHWRSYRYGHLLNDGYLSLKDFDYLRSRSYALPAFGYTVEQLVAAKIFTLKN